MLSLKSPSSTWVGAFIPVEELRYMHQIVMRILLEESGLGPRLHYCVVVVVVVVVFSFPHSSNY